MKFGMLEEFIETDIGHKKVAQDFLKRINEAEGSGSSYKEFTFNVHTVEIDFRNRKVSLINDIFSEDPTQYFSLSDFYSILSRLK